jgi:hypothetical protein
MLKRLTLIASLLFVGNANAAEALLKHDEIMKLLSDRIVYGENNGLPTDQIFQKSGVTYYNSGGSQSQGTWFVQGDQYCSTWPPNPTVACFDIARDGDKVTFIAKSGKRYETRLTK